MLSKSTEVFAKSLGLKITENLAFGIYGKYFLSIYEARTKKIIRISCFIGDSDEYAGDYLTLNDGIREVIDKYSVNDYEVSEKGIKVVSSSPIASLRELTDYLVKLLEENQIPNSHYCSECGSEFKAGEKKRIVTFTQGKNEEKHLLCEQCSLQATEQSEEQTEKTPDTATAEVTNPPVSKGIWLSILAGLVASVLYVLLFYLLGVNGRGYALIAFLSGSKGGIEVAKYFICLLGLITGGLMFWTYKKVVKKITTKAIISLAGISALLIAVSHFFGSVLGLAKYLKTEFSISYSTFSAKFSSYVGMLFSDGNSLRFLIIGFIISLFAAIIAIVTIYMLDYRKAEENRKTKVTIQTVK